MSQRLGVPATNESMSSKGSLVTPHPTELSVRSSAVVALKDFRGSSELKGKPQLTINKGDTVIIDDISLIHDSHPESEAKSESKGEINLMKVGPSNLNYKGHKGKQESSATAATQKASVDQVPMSEPAHGFLDLTRYSQHSNLRSPLSSRDNG